MDNNEIKKPEKKKVDLLASMAAVEKTKAQANMKKESKKPSKSVNNSNSKLKEVFNILFKPAPKKEKVKFKLTFHNVKIVLAGLLVGSALIALGFKINFDILPKAILVGIGSMIILGCILEQRRHFE
ncbi:TPA: hypothetical protein NV714_002341 [Escherichia coli]|nr:hypothetical protein [Escherichia coli]